MSIPYRDGSIVIEADRARVLVTAFMGAFEAALTGWVASGYTTPMQETLHLQPVAYPRLDIYEARKCAKVGYLLAPRDSAQTLSNGPRRLDQLPKSLGLWEWG